MPGYWRAVKGFHGRSLKLNSQKIVIARRLNEYPRRLFCLRGFNEYQFLASVLDS
jgi:hypothetical protein